MVFYDCYLLGSLFSINYFFINFTLTKRLFLLFRTFLNTPKRGAFFLHMVHFLLLHTSVSSTVDPCSAFWIIACLIWVSIPLVNMWYYILISSNLCLFYIALKSNSDRLEQSLSFKSYSVRSRWVNPWRVYPLCNHLRDQVLLCDYLCILLLFVLVSYYLVDECQYRAY